MLNRKLNKTEFMMIEYSHSAEITKAAKSQEQWSSQCPKYKTCTEWCQFGILGSYFSEEH